MIFRLLWRLLLQRLDRDENAAPGEAMTTTGRPPEDAAAVRPLRYRVVALAVVLAAAVLVATVLALLLPAPQTKTAGAAAAALHLNIPVTGAKPLVVYLRGDGLDPPRPGAAGSPVHRIRGAGGRFSPEFQVVPPASTVEMINADSDAHNAHVFNRGETVFNVALPVRGVTVRKVLAGDGVFDVRCDMHPWMKAWMFVPPSRHHAVVHAPATVRFTGIVPGEYILHLWQPERPEDHLPLSLGAGEVRRLRLR